MSLLIRIPCKIYSQCQPLTPLTKGETKIPRLYMKGLHVGFSGHYIHDVDWNLGWLPYAQNIYYSNDYLKFMKISQ
jgi:hypothetical protein